MLVYLGSLGISLWSAASKLTFEQASSHASLVEWNSDSVTSVTGSEITTPSHSNKNGLPRDWLDEGRWV